MKLHRQATLSLLAIAAGCANHADITGTYLPSCVAFAGSRIELSEDRFSWHKFTDEVRVDDSGNMVDPFPNFPVLGTYAIDGDTLRLTTDAPVDYILNETVFNLDEPIQPAAEAYVFDNPTLGSEVPFASPFED